MVPPSVMAFETGAVPGGEIAQMVAVAGDDDLEQQSPLGYG